MGDSEELQRQAVALVRQYGFVLPKAVKEFMRRLAAFLKWDELTGVLK